MNARLGPRMALAVLCTAEAMALLDVIVVAVALPRIRDDLGFSIAGLQWVMTAYALPLGGLLILAGRIGDLHGHRRVFTVGLTLFATGSLAGGLAPAPGLLVAARALQGVGAAALATSALTLLTVVFPVGLARQRALGIFSAVAALGFTLGSIAGGAITQLLGWRWVLLVNVPVAALALLVVPAALPAAPRARRSEHIDIVGAMLVIGGLTAMLYAVAEGPVRSVVATSVWGSAALGVLMLIAFVAWERRAPAPLLPPGFLSAPSVLTPTGIMLLKSSVAVAGTTVPTLYLQTVLGASPLLVGAAFLPGGVLGLLTGLVATRLIDRLGGPRRATLVGLLMLAAALAMLLHMPTDGFPVLHLLGNALLGPGLVLTDITLAGLATQGATDEQRGLTSAVFRTAGQLGAAFGLAVVTAAVVLVAAWQPDPDSVAALRAGLGAGVLSALVLIGAAVAVATTRLLSGQHSGQSCDLATSAPSESAE